MMKTVRPDYINRHVFVPAHHIGFVAYDSIALTGCFAAGVDWSLE